VWCVVCGVWRVVCLCCVAVIVYWVCVAWCVVRCGSCFCCCVLADVCSMLCVTVVLNLLCCELVKSWDKV